MLELEVGRGYSPRSGVDKKKQIGYSPRSGADKRSSCVIRPAVWQIRDIIIRPAADYVTRHLIGQFW